MKEAFVDHKFNASSLDIVAKADAIMDEYAAMGYRLTLRQLYYQLVARGYIENSVRSYKRIGSIVSDARLAGLLDWDMIEDRGREIQKNSHWGSPTEILRTCVAQFLLDHWKDQPCHVEVMVEKDALSGILWPVCSRLDVSLTANKGYSSSSAMYEAGKRMERATDNDKAVVVLYLGDHDPSGIDMTRDIMDRLGLFAYRYVDGGDPCEDRIVLHRLALNYDQVEVWHPPENPAKESDSRFAKYAEEFGESSWELDAVEPATLGELVESAIREVIDTERWQAVEDRQAEMRTDLSGMADEWETTHEEEA